jgi:uncharacterized protein (TIRG00374 family)
MFKSRLVFGSDLTNEDSAAKRGPLLYLLRVGKLLVTLGLISYLFTRLEFGEVIRLFRGIDLWWFVASCTLMGLAIAGGVRRWQILLKGQDVSFAYGALYRVNLIGFFLNNFLPGETGGDIYRAYWVMRGSRRKSAVLTSVVFDRYIGLLGLALLGFVVLGCGPKLPGFETATLVLLFFLVAGAAILALLLSPIFRSLLSWRKLREQSWFQFVEDCGEALRIYAGQKRLMVICGLITILLHLMTTGSVFLLGRGLGGSWSEVSYPMVAGVLPAIFILSALPVSISGWGVGEALFVFFFGKLGVSMEAAVAVSLLNRFVHFCWGGVGGLALLVPSIGGGPCGEPGVTSLSEQVPLEKQST